MKEIEAKILEINKEKVMTKLEDLGAKKILDSELIATFYDFEDKRLKKKK